MSALNDYQKSFISKIAEREAGPIMAKKCLDIPLTESDRRILEWYLNDDKSNIPESVSERITELKSFSKT